MAKSQPRTFSPRAIVGIPGFVCGCNFAPFDSIMIIIIPPTKLQLYQVCIRSIGKNTNILVKKINSWKVLEEKFYLFPLRLIPLVT